MHHILEDFFCKPLQGTQMQEKILNLPSPTSTTVHRSVVGIQNYDRRNNEAKKMGGVDALEDLVST